MLVNGGGSVTLGFSRTPFRHLTRTVFVPWNEIVVLDPPVIMSTGSSSTHGREGQLEESKSSQAPCLQHDSDMLKPFVMSSWLPGMVGASPQNSLIFSETQVFFWHIPCFSTCCSFPVIVYYMKHNFWYRFYNKAL